jgi:DeoR/GlpR family transcriptional regulator of sugar metabolism
MGLLANNKSIKVTMLAELIDVSQVTLRNDLVELEKLGIIRRSRGWVSLDGSNNIGKRLAFSYPIKKKIAIAAAQTIEDGETIMIESGSCCALFAEALALTGKNITIITNSVFVAKFVCNHPRIKIILLGGYFLPDSETVTGNMTKIFARKFFVDKFFLGVDGFIPNQGFTGKDFQCAETALGLTKFANKVYVLTEAEKFKRCGTCSMIQLDKISGVFTDDNIPKEAEAVLIKNNVQLYKVSTVEEKLKWRQFPGLPPILYNKKEE